MGIVSKIVKVKIDGENTVLKVSANQWGEVLDIVSINSELPAIVHRLSGDKILAKEKIEIIKMTLPLAVLGCHTSSELMDLVLALQALPEKQNIQGADIQEPSAKFVYDCFLSPNKDYLCFLTWIGKFLSNYPNYFQAFNDLKEAFLNKWISYPKHLGEFLYSRNKTYALISADFILFLMKEKNLAVKQDTIHQLHKIANWEVCPLQLKEDIASCQSW